MPHSPDRWQRVPRRLRLAVAALIAAGYGLTLAVFYPGIMTYDAKFVYEDIARGVLGDWQSPVMTVLWGVIDPIAPGPGSMFLLGLGWNLCYVAGSKALTGFAGVQGKVDALGYLAAGVGTLAGGAVIAHWGFAPLSITCAVLALLPLLSAAKTGGKRSGMATAAD